MFVVCGMGGVSKGREGVAHFIFLAVWISNFLLGQCFVCVSIQIDAEV